MDLRASLREGLISGIINLFVILLGLTTLFGEMVQNWFELESPTAGAWVLLLLVAAWGVSRAARQSLTKSPGGILLAGLVTGIIHGLLIGGSLFIMSTLIDGGAQLRQWLYQLNEDAVGMLTFGQSPINGALMALGLVVGAGLVITLLVIAWTHLGVRDALGKGRAAVSEGVRNAPAVQDFARFKYRQVVVLVLVAAILLVAPQVIGQYWNYTMGTVGIYVLLGLGLNIVVGFAGLLDLGYVAFFAIGAYTVGLLTAAEPHGLMLSFWVALPIGVLIAALSGILLGIPVLRMRGDYLAIVTLGFGEIIRILAKSDVLTDFSGGPRGVRDIAPGLFGAAVSKADYFMYFMYLILLGIALVAFVTNRLQNSRTGRAWMAMREDEDVAEAMGVFTLKYKLLAFAIGAAFAGLGGAIYASRNQFVGPEDFTLLVSINVLCLVIIGGMGSIPGVIVGALVLKGMPEILRELDEYRMLFFGALLIFMMIVRPEGLWPSKRRQMELREGEEISTEAQTATG
ncbi:MAG: leucine/isoleucine/valine transporter permease subunit [Anaerolineae bacterium]|jgi:branched-chain amino acid transport system permease protein